MEVDSGYLDHVPLSNLVTAYAYSVQNKIALVLSENATEKGPRFRKRLRRVFEEIRVHMEKILAVMQWCMSNQLGQISFERVLRFLCDIDKGYFDGELSLHALSEEVDYACFPTWDVELSIDILSTRSYTRLEQECITRPVEQRPGRALLAILRYPPGPEYDIIGEDHGMLELCIPGEVRLYLSFSQIWVLDRIELVESMIDLPEETSYSILIERCNVIISGSTNPFHDLYSCLHSFYLCLKLDILHKQSYALMYEFTMELDIECEPHRNVIISYWEDTPEVPALSDGSFNTEGTAVFTITVSSFNLVLRHSPELPGLEDYAELQGISLDWNQFELEHVFRCVWRYHGLFKTRQLFVYLSSNIGWEYHSFVRFLEPRIVFKLIGGGEIVLQLDPESGRFVCSFFVNGVRDSSIDTSLKLFQSHIDNSLANVCEMLSLFQEQSVVYFALRAASRIGVDVLIPPSLDFSPARVGLGGIMKIPNHNRVFVDVRVAEGQLGFSIVSSPHPGFAPFHNSTVATFEDLDLILLSEKYHCSIEKGSSSTVNVRDFVAGLEVDGMVRLMALASRRASLELLKNALRRIGLPHTTITGDLLSIHFPAPRQYSQFIRRHSKKGNGDQIMSFLIKYPQLGSTKWEAQLVTHFWLINWLKNVFRTPGQSNENPVFRFPSSIVFCYESLKDAPRFLKEIKDFASMLSLADYLLASHMSGGQPIAEFFDLHLLTYSRLQIKCKTPPRESRYKPLLTITIELSSGCYTVSVTPLDYMQSGLLSARINDNPVYGLAKCLESVYKCHTAMPTILETKRLLASQYFRLLTPCSIAFVDRSEMSFRIILQMEGETGFHTFSQLVQIPQLDRCYIDGIQLSSPLKHHDIKSTIRGFFVGCGRTSNYWQVPASDPQRHLYLSNCEVVSTNRLLPSHDMSTIQDYSRSFVFCPPFIRKRVVNFDKILKSSAVLDQMIQLMRMELAEPGPGELVFNIGLNHTWELDPYSGDLYMVVIFSEPLNSRPITRALGKLHVSLPIAYSITTQHLRLWREDKGVRRLYDSPRLRNLFTSVMTDPLPHFVAHVRRHRIEEVINSTL